MKTHRRRPRAPGWTILAALASPACGGEPSPTALDVPASTDGAGDAAEAAVDTEPPCPAGQARCGPACVAVAADPSNCGACGVACGPGLSCVGGACARVGLGLDGARSLTAAYGSEMIGANILDSCLPGEVLTGIQVEYGEYISRLGGVCSVLDVNDRAVTLSAGHTTGLRGQQSGTAGALNCPAGSVLVGLEGRAGLRVNQLSIRCAPVTLTGDGPLTAAFGASTTVGPVGPASGEARAPALCPAGQVAASVYVHLREAVDGVSLGCRSLRAFALVRGAPEDRPLHGNAGLGALTRDVCPDGQIFTGLRVRTAGGLVVGSMLRCSRVVWLAGNGPWNLAPSAGTPFEERGAHTGAFGDVVCRERSAVAGVSGRTGSGVVGLQFACAEPTVTEAGMAAFAAAPAAAYAGGTGGEPFAVDACPAGSLAIGANVRTTSRLEAFGLICAPFTVR